MFAKKLENGCLLVCLFYTLSDTVYTLTCARSHLFMQSLLAPCLTFVFPLQVLSKVYSKSDKRWKNNKKVLTEPACSFTPLVMLFFNTFPSGSLFPSHCSHAPSLTTTTSSISPLFLLNLSQEMSKSWCLNTNAYVIHAEEWCYRWEKCCRFFMHF